MSTIPIYIQTSYIYEYILYLYWSDKWGLWHQKQVAQEAWGRDKYRQISNIRHQISRLIKRFSSRYAVVFVQTIEAMF